MHATLDNTQAARARLTAPYFVVSGHPPAQRIVDAGDVVTIVDASDPAFVTVRLDSGRMLAVKPDHLDHGSVMEAGDKLLAAADRFDAAVGEGRR